jgi:hypothetical protein
VIYPKKSKNVKSHYRKVNGRLIRVNEFKRKYPKKYEENKQKPSNIKPEEKANKIEKNNLIKDKNAIEELKCALS